MPRTIPRLEGPARAVARGELIGLMATITASSDPTLVGRSGVIVDETLHTLRLREGGGGSMLVPKVACSFAIATPKGTVTLPGAAIEFRPEDRTKKVR